MHGDHREYADGIFTILIRTKTRSSANRHCCEIYSTLHAITCGIVHSVLSSVV